MDALRTPQWHDVMQAEFDALSSNQTWGLVDKLPFDNVTDSLWVFRVKNRPNGSLDKLKAWLVANEARQIEGVDYHNTFSSVIKVVSIR